MLELQKHTLVYVFMSLVLLFILIGLIFIYSSSSVYALEKFGSAHYFVKKQIIGCILGIIGFTLCRLIPIEYIKSFVPLAFYSSLCLTIFTIIPSVGQAIHGSHRWIYIRGISIQPSEFLKTTFILYFAYLLSKKAYRRTSFIHGYMPLLCILVLTSFILLKQPDFGQTVTLCITAFILFFIAEYETKHLLATISLLIPILCALVYLKPYRVKRILIFLNPWNDPQGSGFQIIQSLIAIGSGNITGVGLAQSKQKFFYLPMQHTDFIFSIIAEETGFIGAFALILLFVLFLYCGIRVAHQLKDSFCFYATLGFVFLITLQALINICVTTGLLPTKGLGLPFISYGNCALICNMSMIGMIINFAYNNRALQKVQI